MHVTIQFDYDPSLQATKVHDEAVKYVLPAKLETKHTAIAQQRPRESLCGRRARALLSRQREFLSARYPSWIHENKVDGVMSRARIAKPRARLEIRDVVRSSPFVPPLRNGEGVRG